MTATTDASTPAASHAPSTVALAAASAYAAGAPTRAREVLEAAVLAGTDDRRAWRMLLSLHVREGRHAAADALEGRWRLRFGEPAPAEHARQQADARLAAALRRDGAATAAFAGVLDGHADGAFARLDDIAQTHPVVRVDLARVTSIHADGAERLRARIEALIEQGSGVVLTGAARAVQVLARVLETEGDRLEHWRLRLLAHRLLHDAPAFERAAIEYALATNQPQPEWEPLLMPQPDDAEGGGERRGEPRFSGREMLALRGQMIGADAAQFAQIDAWATDNRWINLDCAALERIDHAAAASLAARVAAFVADRHVVRLLRVDALITPLLDDLNLRAQATITES
jgi:ABC-type transporter Mla MlaB component